MGSRNRSRSSDESVSPPAGFGGGGKKERPKQYESKPGSFEDRRPGRNIDRRVLRNPFSDPAGNLALP
jgi:hypothetical protein